MTTLDNAGEWVYLLSKDKESHALIAFGVSMCRLFSLLPILLVLTCPSEGQPLKDLGISADSAEASVRSMVDALSTAEVTEMNEDSKCWNSELLGEGECYEIMGGRVVGVVQFKHNQSSKEVLKARARFRSRYGDARKFWADNTKVRNLNNALTLASETVSVLYDIPERSASLLWVIGMRGQSASYRTWRQFVLEKHLSEGIRQGPTELMAPAILNNR